jgi:hypothetical protein
MNKVTRPLMPLLALAIAICPLTGAFADDAKDKAATVTTGQASQPKIRVILPASWEPALPQTPPQRSATR